MSIKSDHEVPETEFLFGGYCWFKKAYKIWRFHYDQNKNSFVATILTKGNVNRRGFQVYFSGDHLEDAKKRLVNRLRKSENYLATQQVDMEPFEVIVEMLRSPTREKDQKEIGGPPQMLKVYRSLNRVPFAVLWDIHDITEATLFGMPVFVHREFPYPIIDPDSLKIKNASTIFAT